MTPLGKPAEESLFQLVSDSAVSVMILCGRLYWLAALSLVVVASSWTVHNDCTGSEPLGMISGAIEDWQISASSFYPAAWETGCQQKYARLYQPDGLAWCAKFKSTSEWLQIDLGVPAKISGLMIQGRGDGREWVTSFLTSYSLDGFSWQYVPDSYGNSKDFDGNHDSYKVRHHYFDVPFLCRYVRFHPQQWHRHPSMRVELLGCQKCRAVLAEVPYVKLRTSSERVGEEGTSCWAEEGHISARGGWCAKHNNDKQWIEVDIGPPALIMGVLTAGRLSDYVRQWVTHFRLSYSNDSLSWYFYKGAPQEVQKYGVHKLPVGRGPLALGGESALEFPASNDQHTISRHYLLQPFVARFIRFHPTRWHHHISMRVGVLGCPHTGLCPFGFLRVNTATTCIENMAYKRDSWLLKEARGLKRHIRNSMTQSRAGRVVDGVLGADLHSCIALDNYELQRPLWMVDLGAERDISGVLIMTGQGLQNETSLPDSAAVSPSNTYMHNVKKLLVYVDNSGGRSQIDLPLNMCGFISRLHNALLKPRLHVTCMRRMRGRYIYVEAEGGANPWSRYFRAVLCEVMVYD